VTLRIAARHADATNWQVGLDSFVHKSKVLEQHCDAIGRDFATIARTHGPDCRIFDTQADLDAWLATADGGNLWGGEPHDIYVRDNFVGTVEQLAENTQAFIDAGCTSFVLWFRDSPSTESLERYMSEVVPKLSV
jgi:alkanesulfonate monooxygenase SsuD/methylene tetrahydromethanopterin reductase-like flavin-dependent oxidoreductase (luciferase family)